MRTGALIGLQASASATCPSNICLLIALQITVTAGQRDVHRVEMGAVAMATNMLPATAERQREISLN